MVMFTLDTVEQVLCCHLAHTCTLLYIGNITSLSVSSPGLALCTCTLSQMILNILLDIFQSAARLNEYFIFQKLTIKTNMTSDTKSKNDAANQTLKYMRY